MTRTIYEIWTGVLDGDTRAWAQLVDLYAGLVFTIARRAGLSSSDSEDCAQQTWINLYRRRKSIRDPAALPAWLIRTTHRLALTMRQRTAKQSELAESQDCEEPRLPDEVVSALEESSLVEIALNQLDERCRRLLRELYFSPGAKTYLEIAQELKVKANSLGPLRSRCLQRLKKNLENLGWRVD